MSKKNSINPSDAPLEETAVLQEENVQTETVPAGASWEAVQETDDGWSDAMTVWASEKGDAADAMQGGEETDESRAEKGAKAGKKKKPKKEKKKKKRMSPWLALLIKIFVIGALIFAASFFVQFKAVHDNDMFPALRDGDLVIATNLMKYAFDDVVLYTVEGKNGEVEKHLGRVVSLGDNEVELDDYGNVLVNSSIIASNNYYQDYPKGDFEFPYLVPTDSVYVLQDYRVEMNDSRLFGAIPEEDILGKVIFVFRIRGF